MIKGGRSANFQGTYGDQCDHVYQVSPEKRISGQNYGFWAGGGKGGKGGQGYALLALIYRC